MLALSLGCHKRKPETTESKREAREEAQHEDEEDRNDDRDNYWRVQVSIRGQGRVTTYIDALDCWSDGVAQRGECGPRLLTFKERQPPLMHATGAAGWKLDHWESATREADGTTHPRRGPMPTDRMYMNGFGYIDTGALETVRAIFVMTAADDLAEDRGHK